MRKPASSMCVAFLAGLTAVAMTVSGGQATASPPPSTDGTASTVLLPTGDQVRLENRGGQLVGGVLPAATGGASRVLLSLDLLGHRYELPATAVPYLHKELDPSLFDVSTLAGEEVNGRLPVSVSYRGTAPSVPGVTVTSSGVGSESGYLDLAGAKRFGAALTKQYLADKVHHTADLLFGGAVVSVAGAPPAPSVKPHYVMHTVTVTGNDVSGAADTGADVFLLNVDDLNRFTEEGALDNGVMRFSVPAGNYFAVAVYTDVDSAGNVAAAHAVTKTQFDVSADQTVALDAKGATSQIVMDTPRPSLAQESSFTVTRMDSTGAPAEVGVSVGPGAPLWVSPDTTPITVGALHSYPTQRRSSPPSVGTAYEYYLRYLTDGSIPQQHYMVSAKDLATIDEYYCSEFNTVGVRDPLGLYPFEYRLAELGVEIPTNLPLHQTEYLVGDPSAQWFDMTAKYFVNSPGGPPGGYGYLYGIQADQIRSYYAGETVREDWNRFPLHPTATVDPGTPGEIWKLTPGAVRSGDAVSFYLTPFSDNQPGHSGSGFNGDPRDTITGDWELDQNGTKIDGGILPGPGGPVGPSGPVILGAFAPQQVPVSANPSTLHLVLDAGHTGPMYTLSTASRTEWTWRSAHQQGTTLPNPWFCAPSFFAGTNQNCSVEPLLTLWYAVDNMAVDGSVRQGVQGLDLTVGHLQASAASAITDATVQYSVDGGKTWQNATTTNTGNGTYHASFTVSSVPFNGSLISLRVTAHDAAGGAITETTTNAYLVIH